MHQGTKSQLLPLLEQHASDIPDKEPIADVIIMDGAALINVLRPTKGSTFESYAKDEVLSKIQKHIQKFKQTHIVFDVYRTDSMKAQTRQKRGTGVRRRVISSAKTPGNWTASSGMTTTKQNYLHIWQTRLFHLEQMIHHA